MHLITNQNDEIRKILVTGGYGFIGSNFIRKLLQVQPTVVIVNWDKLSYAGTEKNLDKLPSNAQITNVIGDICDYQSLKVLFSRHSFDVVVHFAAETHVDRSIANPLLFTEVNISGTHNLLNISRAADVPLFLHVSTDEVYGDLGLGNGIFRETDPLRPSNPYSASKAAADLIAMSYARTYQYKPIICRPSNNYGPRQHREKLIPKLIEKAMAGNPLPIYGDGKNIRDWLYVEDCCEGIIGIMERGRRGEIYNLGGSCELSNIAVAQKICEKFSIPRESIKFVPDRAGHDYRYALNVDKAKEHLNWTPRTPFEQGIESTIEWFRGLIT